MAKKLFEDEPSCPRGEIPASRTPKKGKYMGKKVWYCKSIPVAKKHARIRVEDPDTPSYNLVKYKGNYYVVPEVDDGFIGIRGVKNGYLDYFIDPVDDSYRTTHFIMLDVGDLDVPGCQGLCFVNFVPVDVSKYENGQKVKLNEDARTQSILVELEALGFEKNFIEEFHSVKKSLLKKRNLEIEKKLDGMQERVIQKIYTNYGDDIIKKLQYQDYRNKKIKKIEIIKKDLDFKINVITA